MFLLCTVGEDSFIRREIRRAVDEDAFRIIAVTACLANLLYVAVNRQRQPNMDHMAHIGFVNPKGKRILGDHDLDFPGQEVGQRGRAFLVVLFPMVFVDLSALLFQPLI